MAELLSIGGERREAADGASFDVIEPATGASFAIDGGYGAGRVAFEDDGRQ